MTATILRGDALALPIADESVDLIVTSPPYFALRSYTDAGEHYAGQLGSEASPAQFVDALIAATREMVRVLKPSGSIWVNLGDKYSGAQNTGIPNKSLMGIPWRYALRCIDDLGLILRAEVIWSKPNGLPESVTDRVRRSHEQWFHFTREPRYFSAVDEIREAHVYPNDTRHLRNAGTDYEASASGYMNGPANPLGKLPGSVWTIPTEPLTVPAELGVDHFAAFPTEWPRRIIAGWSPRDVCTACGQGRRPVTSRLYDQQGRTTNGGQSIARRHESIGFGVRAVASTLITGYSCACPTPDAATTPGVVLDPFGGTGTVALVADALRRHGISVDLSGDYCRLAQWRTTDPRQRAKAARVDPVEPVPDGQLALFEEVS